MRSVTILTCYEIEIDYLGFGTFSFSAVARAELGFGCPGNLSCCLGGGGRETCSSVMLVARSFSL